MIADILKILRKNHNYTLQQVADGINVNSSTYKNYEYGRREPDLETISRIADFYGVTADYLLERDSILNPFKEIISRMNENSNTMSVIEMYGQLPENVQQAIVDFMSSLLDKRNDKEEPKKQRHVERLGDIEDAQEQERQAKAKDETSCA